MIIISNYWYVKGFTTIPGVREVVGVTRGLRWSRSTFRATMLRMDILSIVLIVFALLELSNVLMLYFAPGTRRGNAVGVFRAYDRSKQDPDVHAFVSYLVNWIAGSKLIFIALIVGIVITGSPATKVFAGVALIASILTFYWRLYPAIRAMDQQGQIEPRGYSRTLGLMIAGFVTVFVVAVVAFVWSSSGR